MEMISRSCPLCGSSDTSNIFADANYTIERLDNFAFASRKTPEFMHYRLIDCPVCDLLYANPLPSEEYLTKGYGEAAYDSSIEAHYAAATYADMLSTFIEQLPDRHGALDIGAGDGAFLECLLERGFDQVAGVEPSRAPIAAARNDIKPLIREGNFNTEDYVPNSFNLVTCFQTLEHLYDPLVMTKSVYSLLKPGGAAFFICHNRRALSAKILGRKSPIFDIEHLQLFSPSSARYLLEKSGFKGIVLLQVMNRYPINYWLKLLPLSTGFKCALINAINTFGAGQLPISIPAGNIAVIGFKI
jgi:SAM-dependent methyltransferase